MGVVGEQWSEGCTGTVVVERMAVEHTERSVQLDERVEVADAGAPDVGHPELAVRSEIVRATAP